MTIKNKHTLIKSSFALAAVLFTASLLPIPVYFDIAHAGQRLEAHPRLFPTSPLLNKKTNFWKKVFQVYPNTTVIVHDVDDVTLGIDMIDFKKFSESTGKPLPSRRQRDKIANQYLKRYSIALKRFETLGRKATKYGAIEQRILQVYKQKPQALRRLLQGKASIRFQTGLANDFVIAAKRAQKYLPYMEKIFARFDVPVVITRLAFVESMFNTNALSKVGASGIWQFMPATAKSFIMVNSAVDERNSPLKATVAAAKYLRQNHRVLKSWPLAITSYNHGASGLKKAVKRFGTRDFTTIVKNHRGRGFGFASKNFYPEFLAAVDTYNKLWNRPDILNSNDKLNFKALVLKKKMTLASIINKTNLTESDIRMLNPDIRLSTIRNKRFAKLPNNYSLFVPKHKFSTAFSALGNDAVFLANN